MPAIPAGGGANEIDSAVNMGTPLPPTLSSDGGATEVAAVGATDASTQDDRESVREAAALADGAVDARSSDVGASHKTFLCNAILGPSVVYDWFTSGFEMGLDDARWEGMAPTQAGISFIQAWTDPNSTLWTMSKLSPCAQGAANPERVIFQGVNWVYMTADEWVRAYEALIITIQLKFPNVREIDLMTHLRAPNNVSCGSIETVVQPFVDAAIQTVVSKHPDLVHAAPKIFAPSCAVFTGGGPHFTDAGKKTVAKVYGDYYATEP